MTIYMRGDHQEAVKDDPEFWPTVRLVTAINESMVDNDNFDDSVPFAHKMKSDPWPFRAVDENDIRARWDRIDGCLYPANVPRFSF